MSFRKFLAGLALGLAFAAATASARADTSLLNVSYDPTREFYQEYNAAPTKYWQGKANEVRWSADRMAVPASRRSVIDGLSADVVTLALAYDVGALATKEPG